MAKNDLHRIALIAAMLLCWPALAQEQGGEEPPDAAEVAGEIPEPGDGEAADSDDGDATGDDGAADDDEVIDDSDLDEQVYEEDDDDFIPSEEIPVDEAIPFPTNI